MCDVVFVDVEWSIVLFCYFNLFGVYESGCIGEDLNGILNNLMLYVM